MKTNLKWLTTESGLTGIKWLAGRGSGTREIDGVCVLDNPDTLRWVRQNELVIISGFLLKEDKNLGVRLIGELAESGCAGLGIKLENYLKEVPAELVAEAERVSFPVLEIPYYMSPAELSRVCYQHMFIAEHERQHREQRFLDDILDILFSNRGVLEIVYRIAEFFSRSVILLDNDFRVLYAAKKMSVRNLCGSGDTLKRLSITDEHHDIFRFSDLTERHVYNLTIPLQKEHCSCLLLEDEHPVSADDEVLLRRCGVILAMGLQQMKAGGEEDQLAQSMLYREFYEYLVGLKELSDRELGRLLTRIGFQADRHRILMILDFHAQRADREPALALVREEIAGNRRLRGCKTVLFGYGYRMFLYVFRRQELPVLDFIHEVTELGRQLTDAFDRQMPDARVRVGVSKCTQDTGNIMQSFRDAEKALDLGERLKLRDRVFRFDDMILYDYFMQYPDRDKSKLYGRIELLREYDRQNNTDLTETLMMFFAMRFSTSRTAEALYIHRNTLLKRMGRIRDLLHMDLDDMNELIPLYLEACAYRIFHRGEENT